MCEQGNKLVGEPHRFDLGDCRPTPHGDISLAS
nr:MAG TPA: hypothetical protein [Caudoviricetes sp.]